MRTEPVIQQVNVMTRFGNLLEALFITGSPIQTERAGGNLRKMAAGQQIAVLIVVHEQNANRLAVLQRTKDISIHRSAPLPPRVPSLREKHTIYQRRAQCGQMENERNAKLAWPEPNLARNDQ